MDFRTLLRPWAAGLTKLPWDIDKKEEKVTGPEKQDEGILFTV